MRYDIVRACRVSVVLGLLMGISPMAWAEDGEAELGWRYSGELSLILAEGNAEASTFGLQAKVERLFEGATLEILMNGLQAESTTTSREAFGTVDDFRVVERSTTETTAEKYGFGLRYDRSINERLTWFLGATWERNELSGFRDRTTLLAGVGQIWSDTESTRFRTDYGVTYTQQDDLIENRALSDGFAGLRLGYDLWHQVTPSTTFESRLGIDANLDETDDLRADLVNALQVAINGHLALKVSLQLLYDNLPALTAVPLFDAVGIPTGDSVTAELDELDSILTVALVLSR